MILVSSDLMKLMRKKVLKEVKGKALLSYNERFSNVDINKKVTPTIYATDINKECFMCGRSTRFADFYLFKWMCSESCNREFWRQAIPLLEQLQSREKGERNN